MGRTNMRTPWDSPKIKMYCKECGGEWYFTLAKHVSITGHRCILCGGTLQKEQKAFDFHLPPMRRNSVRASKKRKKVVVEDRVYEDVLVTL